HQMWAAGRLRFEAPRRWITSGGLGTMGFGLPSALGAQAASPDSTVVCVSGEGSFLMNVQELATAVEEQLPVKVLLLDNASLGMVRQQQDLFWGGRRTAVDQRRVTRAQRGGERGVWERNDRPGELEERERAAADAGDGLDDLGAGQRRRQPLRPREQRLARGVQHREHRDLLRRVAVQPQ